MLIVNAAGTRTFQGEGTESRVRTRRWLHTFGSEIGVKRKEKTMNHFKTAVLAVLGTLALTASASAAVVCNDEGDCWRTKERLAYPPQARVQIYGDDYAIGPKYRWRDAREGNGYYRGGVWIGF